LLKPGGDGGDGGCWHGCRGRRGGLGQEPERSRALADATRGEGPLTGPAAVNPVSGAFGIPQALPATKMDMDELDAALGGLRAAGWPAPEDPGGDDDAELDGRDLICDRLLDEVGWLRQCAG